MDIYIVWFLNINPDEHGHLDAIGAVIHGAYKDELEAIKTACTEQINSPLYGVDDDNIEENSKMANWLSKHSFPSIDALIIEWKTYFELLSNLMYYDYYSIIESGSYSRYNIDIVKLV